MKELIIIGAGGMGRTMYDLARESVGYGNDFVIKGFIDDNLFALDEYPHYPSIVGTVSDYFPQVNEVFISSIGGKTRKKSMEEILCRGGKFIDLIHKTARIGTNVKMGIGNFIGAYCVIGADASIGDYNMIQSYSVIGHDVKMGNWNRIDTHVVCVGGIVIEDEIVVHTSAVINHNVVVESNAQIGACSFVIKKVKAGTTVFGIPAKKISL